MSRYRSSRGARRCAGSIVALLVVASTGCAALRPEAPPQPGAGQPAPQSAPEQAEAAPATPAVVAYLEFMNRVAVANGDELQRIAAGLESQAGTPRPDTQLRRGLLLTTPAETLARTREGETMLREYLAAHSELDRGVRALVQLRLREAAARQVLRIELGEANGTIDELLSIESSMEKQKLETQGTRR